MTGRFRYRTTALIGPWRDTPEAAAQDAIRGGQAIQDEECALGSRWRVEGYIEQGSGIAS